MDKIKRKPPVLGTLAVFLLVSAIFKAFPAFGQIIPHFTSGVQDEKVC